MRWPRYWSFSLSIIPSKEIPGLISFRMDWLDLLAVQGTLKSLFQHHSSKTSILWRSAFFTVQLSHPYMTTGKTKYKAPKSEEEAKYLIVGMIAWEVNSTLSFKNISFPMPVDPLLHYTKLLEDLWQIG